ncbi:enoyl-CoA hydratase-related protein [Microbacterium sp. ET2]|uniref:enoyl-CoA hydratase-related protein n=1 Tax=Microbacterium albipurpureum TaxID=3050384 RepID=UPI00259CF942|nr:enoyl-CoA hydratase-related protein [Microbacterium sp. ET2 (Ac-2212)]WJL96908.1 enoyl-CoA hydratase-related protein [Microbacterium sp. ET2 (Ac-2212)]
MTGTVDLRADRGVATLTFSNPRSRNAIDRAMYDAFEGFLRDIRADESVRAVVLRGADGAFVGGTDIRWLQEITSGPDGVAYEAHMRRVQVALTDVDVPIIAVVDGACVGGGIVLAALSDLVVCTPSSRFGSPIARTVGNTLSPTSIARLSATFGRRNTAEMLFTARLFSAEEALQAGFVTSVVDADGVEEHLDGLLDAIRSCAPLTLRSFRRLWRRVDAVLADAPRDDVYAEIYGSADFQEGVAAFLDKRRPSFEGR